MRPVLFSHRVQRRSRLDLGQAQLSIDAVVGLQQPM